MMLSQKRYAFTLIELLVVIAIIVLLVSILIPSLKRVQSLATRVSCASQLRGIGTALHLYAQSNHQRLPEKTSHHGPQIVGSAGKPSRLGLLIDRENFNDGKAGFISDKQILYCPGRIYEEGWPFTSAYMAVRYAGYSFCDPGGSWGASSPDPNYVLTSEARPKHWAFKNTVDYISWVACFRDGGEYPLESPHENDGINAVSRTGSVMFFDRPEVGWPLGSAGEAANTLDGSPMWEYLSEELQ